jgi:ABC-2 type transport system ATP-binding protein
VGTAQPAIQVERLRRVYSTRRGMRKGRGDVVALDGIDQTIPVGEVHGLLGPNGAGKTTLCKVLSTVLLPTSVTARILGHDVVEATDRVRPLVGIVFGGERGLYTRLTGRQNLEYWAALYRKDRAAARRRAEELLERVGLADRADDLAEDYSRGMRQRLHLARGLIGDPPVLLLDEPTTGMDPLAARDFRTLIGELRGEGRTILLATHDMIEAESVCDRVTLIDEGRIIATEQPRTLAGWISRFERIDADGVDDALIAEVRRTEGVAEVTRTGHGSVRIETNQDGATAQILSLLVSSEVTKVQTSLPSLEEVYIHLIGDRGFEIHR